LAASGEKDHQWDKLEGYKIAILAKEEIAVTVLVRVTPTLTTGRKKYRGVNTVIETWWSSRETWVEVETGRSAFLGSMLS
jgi:hypothetical protein